MQSFLCPKPAGFSDTPYIGRRILNAALYHPADA